MRQEQGLKTTNKNLDANDNHQPEEERVPRVANNWSKRSKTDNSKSEMIVVVEAVAGERLSVERGDGLLAIASSMSVWSSKQLL